MDTVNLQEKLELLKQAAIAADAVVKSHTPGSVPSATSEQMRVAKHYMTMAVPGFILKLFAEIDRLQADLAKSQKDADRWIFCGAAAHNPAFTDALDPFMAWANDVPEMKTIEEINEHTDRCIQVAKDNGLWPIKPEPELTDEAQADRDEFESMSEERGCSCHISSPCAHCIHPGNPLNQEDPSCWKVQP